MVRAVSVSRQVKIVLGIPCLVCRLEGRDLLGGVVEIGEVVAGLKGKTVIAKCYEQKDANLDDESDPYNS